MVRDGAFRDKTTSRYISLPITYSLIGEVPSYAYMENYYAHTLRRRHSKGTASHWLHLETSICRIQVGN